mmetsp:Transcript_87996/g.138952  ORF Transcript_87996/g.138952 Transcript_87996/m.138952 type:complete len:569 (+) Transcript_87996:90-1796(+)
MAPGGTPNWISVAGRKSNAGNKGGSPSNMNTGFQAKSDRIFVSRLPPYMTDEMLEEVFGNYGTVVSTSVIQNAKPSKDGLESVCLITMSSQEEAASLLQKLDGNIPDGLLEPVSIKFASGTPAMASKPTSMQMAAVQAAAMDTTQPLMERAIYVGNLPKSMDQETFVSICGIHGKVIFSQLLLAKSAGIAVFATVKEAQLALDIVNGFEHEGLLLTAKAADGSLPFTALRSWERQGIDGTAIPDTSALEASEQGGKKKTALEALGWSKDSTEYQVRPHTSKLYVTGLPTGSSEDSIRETFAAHGEVMNIRIVWSNSWGTGSIVQMADRWVAGKIVRDMHGAYCDKFQCALQIKLAESPEEYSRRDEWNKKMGKVTHHDPHVEDGNNGKGQTKSRIKGSTKGNPQLAAQKGAVASDRDSRGPYGQQKGKGKGQTKQWEASPDIRAELATDIAVEGMPEKATKFDLVRLFGRFGSINGITLASSSNGKVAFVQFKNPDHAGVAVEKVNGVPLGDGTVLEVLPRWMTENYAEQLAAEAPDEAAPEETQESEEGWDEEWDAAAEAAEQAWST